MKQAAELPLGESPDTKAALTRRGLMAGLAAAATLSPLREATAQSRMAGGDWLEMVKTQHTLISKTFDTMLEAGKSTFLKRETLEKALSYQLTAHSVAEENVLYPALARNGLVTESDKLYLDQAHAKVKNAELKLMSVKDESAWFAAVRALRDDVLKHAKQDEEAMLYPQLKAKLDAPANALLTREFEKQFASVKLDRSPA